MDLDDLDRMLGIDATDPVDLRARRLVEASGKLVDDLIALRERKGLTQLQLADRMGISQSGVARIEGGDRDPRLSTLRRYALALGAMIEHDVTDDEAIEVKSPVSLGKHTDTMWPKPERRVESGKLADA